MEIGDEENSGFGPPEASITESRREGRGYRVARPFKSTTETARLPELDYE